MADTTLANVILMAPDLSWVTSGNFSLYLSDAKLELAKYTIPNEAVEKSQRLLVAHLATVSRTSGGIITKKKLGPMELSYASSSTNNSDGPTIWWDELQRLLANYGVKQMRFALFS